MSPRATFQCRLEGRRKEPSGCRVGGGLPRGQRGPEGQLGGKQAGGGRKSLDFGEETAAGQRSSRLGQREES